MSVALGRSLYPLTLSKEMKQIGLSKHAMRFDGQPLLFFFALPSIPLHPTFLPISSAYCSSVKPCSLTPDVVLCARLAHPQTLRVMLSPRLFMLTCPHPHLQLDFDYLMIGSTRFWTY